jgi:signal transduction histidine kinase
MAKAKEVLKANLEGKPTGPGEFVLQAKGGRRVTVEIRTFPARIGHEDVILGIARDISKKKELEKQLRESQKMEAIGTLAGGIAHDFNNILSAVIGYTELALDDTERGTSLHAKLSEVLTAGNRAKDLVKQILAVSRHTEEVNKPIQINSLVREALKMLRSTIPASIAIRENIGAQPLIVHGDPTRIHQVMVNLATNAMYAMTDREGILEVGVEPISFDESTAHKYPDLSPGNYVRLTVSDTGVGIPEEILDKIFEPYFTTKEKGEGTGLGLSVVHGIVKSHKGHIKAYTEPGKGTAFHVYLPLAGSFSTDPSTRAAEPLPTGTESILLVDDEPPIVDMQQQRLEQLGYTVTARTGSLEALEAFRSSPGKFDLVITDMTMPHMTGDKLAYAVKQIRPDVPVILCTGFSEKVNGHEEDLAIDGFLMKPVDKAKMAKTVRKTLDKA